VWAIAPDIFFIDVPQNDPNVVEFISTGVREVTVHGTKVTARAIAALIGKGTFRGQLEEAVWDPAKLKPTGSRIKAGTKVDAYCHGVFLLPGEKTLCLVVGRTKPVSSNAWIAPTLKVDIDALLLAHNSKVAEFDEGIKAKKEANDALKERYQADNSFGAWGDAAIAVEEMYQRPIVTVESLLQSLPLAAKYPQPISGDPDKVARAATTAVAASGWLPSRDGNYVGILPLHVGRRAQGLVSWVPHTGLPSYPEVRWAVQRRLPSALHKPRSRTISPPEFDTVLKGPDELIQVNGFDPNSTDLQDALEEVQLDQGDFRSRVDDIRTAAKTHGFEAIAWYQPYHVWSEDTWGIYFDVRKLDDLALSFLDDFRSQHVHGSHRLAALLAFGLVYAHEMFHARVEAALSWQELNALLPKHLRYKDRVYQALRETPEWLEEALANWSAWDWFKSPDMQAAFSQLSSNAGGLTRVVEASLDLSPPGYQEWRLGHQLATWRTFATQLTTAKPKLAAPGIGLPLESIVGKRLPYDFQVFDIPLRFVGSGVIADRLQSHPVTFNVPPRREMEKALRYFRHNLDASGGKGGHQKWTGPDQRAFILPTRDPVSTGVFKTFLHHVGIDKATYVRQVRPNL
jgi:hypothetical protein